MQRRVVTEEQLLELAQRTFTLEDLHEAEALSNAVNGSALTDAVSELGRPAQPGSQDDDAWHRAFEIYRRWEQSDPRAAPALYLLLRAAADGRHPRVRIPTLRTVLTLARVFRAARASTPAPPLPLLPLRHAARWIGMRIVESAVWVRRAGLVLGASSPLLALGAETQDPWWQVLLKALAGALGLLLVAPPLAMVGTEFIRVPLDEAEQRDRHREARAHRLWSKWLKFHKMYELR